MVENILDYVLAHPNMGLEQVLEMINFHIDKVSTETKKEIQEDLEHAFAAS